LFNLLPCQKISVLNHCIDEMMTKPIYLSAQHKTVVGYKYASLASIKKLGYQSR
jgi:hypothetical protein